MCLHLLFYVNTFMPSLSPFLRGSCGCLFFFILHRCWFCCALVVRSCRPCLPVAPAVVVPCLSLAPSFGGRAHRWPRPSLATPVAGPVRRWPRPSVAPARRWPRPSLGRARRWTVPVGFTTMRMTGVEGEGEGRGERRRRERGDDAGWLCPPFGPLTHLPS